MARKKRESRTYLQRSRGAVIVLVLIALSLTFGNLYIHRRDVDIALGPTGPQQLAFFTNAAERPDISDFYSKLSPREKIRFAQNLAQYVEPAVAELATKLLNDFDAGARKALTETLTTLARKKPELVVDQLKASGSFARTGIVAALTSAGSAVLPLAAQGLTKPDVRQGAKDFLIQVGAPAIPHVLPVLRSEDGESRLAAADVLGKLRAADAAPALEDLLHQAKSSDERLTFVAALASIGSASSEGQLLSIYADITRPSAIRQQAALGLGRIASPRAVALLWEHPTANADALAVAGDKALVAPGSASLAEQIEVASRIQSPLADRVILQGLKQPATRTLAAEAISGRGSIVPAVHQLLIMESNWSGETQDALVRALTTTPEGIRELKWLTTQNGWSGWAQRALQLVNISKGS